MSRFSPSTSPIDAGDISGYAQSLSHDFDLLEEDTLDSGSSSSGDHSSPSSDLAYPSSTGADWAYDLGLAVPGIGGLARNEWSAPGMDAGFRTKGGEGVKGGEFNAQGMLVRTPDDDHGLALTSDFWSTAPNTAAHTPMEIREFEEAPVPESQEARSNLDPSDGSGERMEVDFDTGTLTSIIHPGDSYPTSSTTEARSVPSPSEPSFYPDLSSSSMNILLDSSADGSGIAPQLTGGQRTPSILEEDGERRWGGDYYERQGEDDDEDRNSSRPGSGSEDEAVEAMGMGGGNREETSMDQQPEASTSTTSATAPEKTKAKAPRRTKSTATTLSGSPSRESSQSRKGTVANEAAPSTNLVAMDAVVAASMISTLGTPSRSSAGLQLLVLGVPTSGAKSRVETQIKISLALVAPKPGKVKNEDDEAGGSDLITPEGGIRCGAGKEVLRVGSWSHVRLPKYLALKKTKTVAKGRVDVQDTLILDVRVVSASDPNEEITICAGCQARERKRAQRKKEAKVRPSPESGENEELDEEEEGKKVVVFNCTEVVDFREGEVVLPTRITCYCRHHKEKIGFVITFSLRDAAGNVVASAASPPIMITDDHKTPGVRSSAANSTTHSADVSANLQESPLTRVELAAPVKKLKATKKKKTKKEKVHALTFPVPTPPVDPSLPLGLLIRPMRTAARRAIERLVKPEDDVLPSIDSTLPSPSTSTPISSRNANGPKKFAAPKPYDSDSRPRKRQAGVHKSPSFAMTPVTTGPSKPNSPTLSPVPDTQTSQPTFESMDYSEALGLGGMSDSVMENAGTSSNTRSTSTAPSYSTAPSSIASPGPSYDWRASGSPPSLSPREISPPDDPFASFFASLHHDNHGFGEPEQQHQQQQSGSAFDPMYGSAVGLTPLGGGASALGWGVPVTRPAPEPPRISRLIPGEGPVHGGIEVTVLGENFVPDLVCVFGEAAAVPTHFWSSSTLVCILPPSANPGPVVVGIKGVPLGVDSRSRLQLFTYKDDSDRSLLELALQVVGLKMTGKLEDATAVAMRIVGNSRSTSAANTPSSSRHTSPSVPNDAAGLAMRMNAASASVYSTPAPSRPPSRQASFVQSHSRNGIGTGSPPTSSTPLPFPSGSGETRNFEGIVIKFLSLLDLDPAAIPGSTQSVTSAQSSISFLNSQRHSLLHLATVLGFHRLVAFLLARGIDIESADRNGYTALHFAALYGRVSITRQLLEAGATMYARNFAGQTPVDIARSKDDVDVEELFLRSRPLNPSLPVDYRSRLSISTSIPPQHPQAPVASRSSSLSRAPAPRYSQASDESEESESETSSDDDDDDSFHSSDEDGIASDVERGRGLSRNPSLVSLHYLLEAEAEVDDKKAYPTPPPEERPHPQDVKEQPLPPSTTTAIHDLASASSAWLARTLRPSYPPSSKPDTERTGAPSNGVTAVWEKMPALPYANNAWEKMRLPTGFVLPIQIPVAAFPNMMPHMPASLSPSTWMGNKTEVGAASAEGDLAQEEPANAAPESGAAKDWRTLYGPWWQTSLSSKLSASPPPPMYTPTDTFARSAASSAPSSPSPSTSSLPLPGSPTQKEVALKLRQRLGYLPEEISEAVVRSSLHHEKKMAGLKQDRMLFFFWLPILLFVCGFVLYANYLETLLPFLRSIPNTPFLRT